MFAGSCFFSIPIKFRFNPVQLPTNIADRGLKHGKPLARPLQFERGDLLPLSDKDGILVA